jgi:hypothetical protein
MSNDRSTVLEQAKAERRHFKRVNVELSGRLFIPADNREARCQIVDLSPGGAQVVCETVPAAGEQVVIYIDNFGRFEGTVARPAEGSFAVRFQCSAMKREKIAEQLTLLLNRDLVDETQLSRALGFMQPRPKRRESHPAAS